MQIKNARETFCLACGAKLQTSRSPSDSVTARVASIHNPMADVRPDGRGGVTTDPEGRYSLEALLGKGSTSKVYRARRRSDGRLFALKLVRLAGFSEAQRAELLNEVEMMSRISHPNVVAYEESFVHEDSLCVLMELLDGGDLGTRIASLVATGASDVPDGASAGDLPEDTIWSILVQVCEGLAHMHSLRVLHRDIKAENIFCDSRGTVKIGDLGLSRLLLTTSSHATTGVGTPLYFSPEMCEERPYNDRSDVWALGCLVYELCALRPPFVAANQLALARKISCSTPAPLPTAYSRELQLLVTKLLEKDELARPSAKQVLAYAPVRARRKPAESPPPPPPPPPAAEAGGGPRGELSQLLPGRLPPRLPPTEPPPPSTPPPPRLPPPCARSGPRRRPTRSPPYRLLRALPRRPAARRGSGAARRRRRPRPARGRRRPQVSSTPRRPARPPSRHRLSSPPPPRRSPRSPPAPPPPVRPPPLPPPPTPPPPPPSPPPPPPPPLPAHKRSGSRSGSDCPSSVAAAAASVVRRSCGGRAASGRRSISRCIWYSSIVRCISDLLDSAVEHSPAC